LEEIAIPVELLGIQINFFLGGQIESGHPVNILLLFLWGKILIGSHLD